MPPRKNDSPHRHSEPTPAAPRRKSKPKFELPPELETVAGSAAADIGWVYRADKDLPPVTLEPVAVEVLGVEAVVDKAVESLRHVPPAELAADAVLASGRPAPPFAPLPPSAHSPGIAKVAFMAGLGAMALGAIAVGMVSAAAFTIATAPFRLLHGVLNRGR